MLRVLERLSRMWGGLAPKSLTNRVFALYGVTLIVFFAAGLTLFLSRQYEEQVLERQESAVMLIEVAAQAVQDSAVIGDYDTVQKTLEKSVQGSFFGQATFIDLTGSRLEAKGSATPGAEPPHWFERWVASQFIDINRAINVGGKDYGVLRLGFNTHYVAGDMWALSRVAFAAALLSLVLGLIPIRVLIKRWLGNLDRLKSLESAMTSGTLDVSRLQSAGAPEEIQRVVDMFKRTAELIQEREASRRALDNQKFALDQHAIVTITDLRGIITYANDRFCAISGYNRDELAGQTHRILKSGVHDASFYSGMWRTIASGKVWRGEICNRNRSGDLVWLSATIVPLTDASGVPEQYIAIRTDITDRKVIEVNLQKAKEAAEQANVAKSQFLANISHEIRTPLNAVLGMLKLLQRTGLNDRQADYLTKSESAAKSLLLLLNDVLDFSKAEANKIVLDPKPFRLEALLEDLAVVLSANVGEKDLEVLIDLDPTMPPWLVGDDLRLAQVLINLGGNAIKFTSSGWVRLKLVCLSQEQGWVALRVRVEDSGIGIASDKLKTIFSGFTQAEASITRRFGGSGLGLAISRRLVQLMGGDILVQSEEGQGSVFSFDLRLPVAPAPEQQRLLSHDVKLPEELGQLRVGIATSHDKAAVMLAGWWAEQQCEWVNWSDPASLERDLMNVDPSALPWRLVMVDARLLEPSSEWLEALSRLQEAGRLPPWILMSTLAQSHALLDEAGTVRAKPDGVLIKPLTRGAVMKSAASVLRPARFSDAPETPVSLSRGGLLGVSILLVEDNANNRQVACELLESEGATVSVAEHGQAGWDLLNRSEPLPQVVLMDLQMPVMDGFTATRLIRADATFRDLPVIAMTANISEADRQACLNHGFNAHVGKPFDLPELVQTIRDLVGLGPLLQAPEPVVPNLDSALVQALEGLEVKTSRALARFAGQRGPYLRMLRKYLRDLPADLDTAQAAVEREETTKLQDLAHSFKGVSGMLGAEGLQALWGRLETAIHRAEGPWGTDYQACQAAAQRWMEERDRLLALVEQSLDSLEAERLVPEPSAALAGQPDEATWVHLMTALRRSDLRALDHFDRLRPGLRAVNETLFHALSDAMDALDFERARALIATMMEEKQRG